MFAQLSGSGPIGTAQPVVGLSVGLAVGAAVVGTKVGAEVGCLEGAAVGPSVGEFVGTCVGARVDGAFVGTAEGAREQNGLYSARHAFRDSTSVAKLERQSARHSSGHTLRTALNEKHGESTYRTGAFSGAT